MDLEMAYRPEITSAAQRKFSGVLDSHQICFFGLCPACAENQNEMEKEKKDYEKICM
jgi:Fe2+ or Zn2+ uptake regulation protein